MTILDSSNEIKNFYIEGEKLIVEFVANHRLL